MDHGQSGTQTPDKKRMLALTIGAIGVVYGDIGTSPLYAMREALHPVVAAGGDLRAAVLGVASLLIWALLLIVTLKYVVFLMKADNKGEGGILSLVVLVETLLQKKGGIVLSLCIIGAAFFFGDAMITPAMSVLSAVEGLKVVNDGFDPYVVPLTLSILITLFLFQYKGTAGVASLFAPITFVWFLALGVMGVMHIFDDLDIFRALNPAHGLAMLIERPGLALLVFGGVFLAVTGGEALYADMGHFGQGPIRMAWAGVIVCLVCSYFGQGALLLASPGALGNLFFNMAPSWALFPLVALATCATVIASQAVISGVFSLTRQAIQLGYLPRMDIRHTSATEMGQIYIPQINWMLMIGITVIVVSFGSSSDLTHAYGLAVTGAMLMDTILAAIVARWLWGWSRWLTACVFGVFLVVDLLYVGSNMLKIPTGGWLPIVIAVGALAVFLVWNRGREILVSKLYRDAMPIEEFLERWDRTVERVTGTAVFMTSNPSVVPTAFLHNLKHNHVVHERVVIMKVNVDDVPRVGEAQRIEVEKLGKGFHKVTVHYGFMERPDVPRALELCRPFGLSFDLMQTTFFLGRETLIPASRSELRRWQAALFIAMQATALSATRFFRIPANRVVEMGTQVEI